jgi:hypothetical protein
LVPTTIAAAVPNTIERPDIRSMTLRLMPTKATLRALLRWSRDGLCAALAATALAMTAVPAAAAPPRPAVGGPLLDLIESMPAGQWQRINRNPYSDAWTPADLRPLNKGSNMPPSKIILAWSGFGWDTRRGDIILYGGGHANYSGNDVYRFRSSSLAWERAALPSEIAEIGASNAFTAIDGADAAPASAHTYDNNIYLPEIDRFLAFGGALYDTGGAYMRPDESNPGALRKTGPYLFDPTRADPNKVGGTTGSHVQRVAPHPEIVGGNMWQNRDMTRYLAGQRMPDRYVNGCTGYADENGHDVVYIGAPGGGGTNLDLFRYEIDDVANPASDQIAKVGIFWRGTSNQTTCAYDPSRLLFVRTGSNTVPFTFWDLSSPGLNNQDWRVDLNDSITAFQTWLANSGINIINCALDLDPIDHSFAIWCGGPQVWKLHPPPTNVTAGWSIDSQYTGGTAPPIPAGTGILGKWKYAPGYDVFVALENEVSGNVWIYKPVGWTPPQPGDPVNWVPDVDVTMPHDGDVFATGASITLRSSAFDSDGHVIRVAYLANGVVIGSATASPYTLAWTPPVNGHYVLQARATDDGLADALSDPVGIDVLPPNVPPTVSLSAPADGSQFALGTTITVSANAGDSDGSVVDVDFTANGQNIGDARSAPFAIGWTPTQQGTYTLQARATDNRGGMTPSATRSVQILPPNTPPTVTLTQPADGSSVASGSIVGIAANASDSDPGGTVAKVEFFVDGQKIGEDASAPYAFAWTATSGNHTLTARATDNLGATTDSAPVGIIVTDGGGGSSTTVVLQRGSNGYSGSADTLLSVYNKTTNFGSNPTLINYAQDYTNLFRFATFASEGGPVPNGATIVAAKLEIYKDVYNYVYEVHPMLKAWSETQATYNVATTGNPWTTPGANGAGTDYAAAADAQFAAPWDAGWMSFDVTNRMQLISQGGAPNFGWRIVGVSGNNNTRKLYSSEYAVDPSLRPRLTVTYTSP